MMPMIKPKNRDRGPRRAYGAVCRVPTTTTDYPKNDELPSFPSATLPINSNTHRACRDLHDNNMLRACVLVCVCG